jgi:hypothetical protein
MATLLQLYTPLSETMSKRSTESFTTALQKTKLDDLQKHIIQERYGSVLKSFETRCTRLAILFHILRILVSIGSLIVPALLSIQYSDTSSSTTIKDPDSFAYEIYWATWVISLLVTTSNGVLTVFKVDKKYYFLHTTMEQLKSEGWQFLELSGRYSGFYTPGSTPTHTNQFIYFCHAVEKIKMHQVEEEYFKLTEQSQTPTTQGQPTKSDKSDNSLVHPTPQASLGEIAKNLPPDLRRQLISMVSLDGATAPTVSVSGDVQTSASAQSLLLRQPQDAEVQKDVPA